MNEALRTSVTAGLVEHGWTAVSPVALAIKSYQTAVGPKEAHTYLADYGPACECVLISGDYQSEGRNALESHSVMLPRNADANQVKQLVAKFCQQAEAVIAETYAARLFHKFGHVA
jgi:hypothetical protein